MGLPFLKNRDDGVGQDIIETKEREHDEDFDMLDAVAEDLMQALEKKDRRLVKEALTSLCQHIMEIDEEQDKQTMGAE